MTDLLKIERFLGDPNDKVDSGGFFDNVQLLIRFGSGGNMDDGEKIATFGMMLESGSEAKEWFEEEIEEKVTTWTQVKPLFFERFPKQKKAKLSQEEHEDILLEMRLKEEELLERNPETKIRRIEEFANEVLRVAKLAGIANTKTHIRTFRQNLPRIVREKVSTAENWKRFAEEIVAVLSDYVRDEMEKREEEKRKEAEVERKIQLRALSAMHR